MEKNIIHVILIFCLILLNKNAVYGQELGDIKVPVKSATASSFQVNSEIEKSIDGDYNTIYHSDLDNTPADYFPITIDYFFENEERIDYIIYHPRYDDMVNGNFKEFDLYIATEDEPTLKKYGSYDFAGRPRKSRITLFKPAINPTQIQFVVKSGRNESSGKGFASCSEMEFYKKINTEASSFGDFPYIQTFLSSSKPDEITVPTSTNWTNSAVFTSDGLQLTPAVQSKFGGMFINNRQFNTTNGILIEFEYMMYGGTGADGLSVFLFDAMADNPEIGSDGAAIGYTYSRAHKSMANKRRKGLTGAYLGIALDSYANFKATRWEPGERISGATFYRGGSEVTLRGARGIAFPNPYKSEPKILQGMEYGYTGYPVLLVQPTQSSGTYRELLSTGSYSSLTTYPSYKGNFTLRGGTKFNDDSDTGYRKAIIELFPINPSRDVVAGMYVTVKIQHGKTVTTVISDYEYKHKFMYRETAMPAETDGDESTAVGSYAYSNPLELSAAPPDLLRIGFAAATGSSTDIHLIRNLTITLPRSAEAYPDYATTASGVKVNIPVLNNDIAFEGTIQRVQEGKSEYLDPSTFQFITAEGIPLGKGAFNHTSPEGKWVYNPTTKVLSFTPNVTFVGQAHLYYTIKGGLPGNEEPYKDEAYRSMPAKVTVDVIEGPAIVPSFVLSNKMISPAIK